MMDAQASTGSLCCTFRLTPHFHQALALQRVFQTVGAVEIPGVAGTARAAARFVVWHIRAGARIVGLLHFQVTRPFFTKIFQLHEPVQFTPWVERTTLSCCSAGGNRLPSPVGIQNLAVPIGKSFTLLFEVAKPVQNLLIGYLLCGACGSLNRHLLICSEGNALKEGEN